LLVRNGSYISMPNTQTRDLERPVMSLCSTDHEASHYAVSYSLLLIRLS